MKKMTLSTLQTLGMIVAGIVVIALSIGADYVGVGSEEGTRYTQIVGVFLGSMLFSYGSGLLQVLRPLKEFAWRRYEIALNHIRLSDKARSLLISLVVYFVAAPLTPLITVGDGYRWDGEK